MTETIADALNAILADGFANVSPSIAGGCLHGAFLPWGDSIVYVTENEVGPGFTLGRVEVLLGLYTAEEYATTGEAHHYEDYTTVAALVAGVNKHLGVEDE
jgi:hypothetical protein